MSTKPGFYGWQVLAAMFTVYFLCIGFPLYGGSVINSLMLKDIPMDRSIYGLGFTLMNFCVGVQSLLIAICISNLGIRWTIIIGNMIIMIGALCMAFMVSEPWHFVVGFGVVIGSGIAFSTVLPTTTGVSRWFARKRGRAMAVLLVAPSIAGLVAASAMNWVVVISDGNWRNAWIVIAVLMILSAIVAFIFVKESPEKYGQFPDGEEMLESKSEDSKALLTTYDWTPREAYRTMAYWMILIGACACQFPFFLIVAHWIPFMKELAYSPASAAFAMGLFTIGSFAGRLISGWLMDKIPAQYCFMMGMCFYLPAAIIAITLKPDVLMLAYGCTLTYGFGFGWTFVSMQTVTANFYGPKIFHKLNGTIMLLSSGIICSGTGVLGGKIYDIFKSYVPAFELTALFAIVGIIALVYAKMPKPKGI